MKHLKVFLGIALMLFMVSPIFAKAYKVVNTTDNNLTITADRKGIGFWPGKEILLTEKEYKSSGIQKAIKEGKLKVVGK